MLEIPLIVAARHGSAAEVAALLAGGADVNEPMSDGETPLFIACQEGHTEVVTKLLADFPIPFEVFEVFVMPHMVTRDYQPSAG